MKTLSFLDLVVGREARAPLVEVDTARDGIAWSAGLYLIVAPNGYGKTTFLQTVAGVLPALRGECLADGKALNAERDVLYVSEYLSFPKFIYPAEWIEYMSDHAREAALDEWIDAFSLRPKLGSFLGRMSQGERRKVTWLGAQASRKPVLLLDEPLDGLDILAIRAARRMVERWKADGRIVCVVAHQVHELLDLADEVFLIRERVLKRWSAAAGRPAAATPGDEFRRKVLEFYS
jgi:ABC-type multidrug transport system ATPase subunit